MILLIFSPITVYGVAAGIYAWKHNICKEIVLGAGLAVLMAMIVPAFLCIRFAHPVALLTILAIMGVLASYGVVAYGNISEEMEKNNSKTET